MQRGIQHKLHYDTSSPPLEVIEELLQFELKGYVERFGEEIKEVPKEVITDYQKITPEEVAQSIMFFNIKFKEPNLFWLARAYLVLPLPTLWTTHFSLQHNAPTFINHHTNIEILFHPAFFYILQ